MNTMISAADVSEGKKDPIYNAHSYLTKAPTEVSLLPASRLMMTIPLMNRFTVAMLPGVNESKAGNMGEITSLG